MKLYGEELRQQIIRERDMLIENMKERDERIASGQTDWEDCFMSIQIERKAIAECEHKLHILDGDGLGTFEAIFDQDGKEVNVRWVNTKYGIACVGRGIFANSYKALCKKTGWTIKEIKAPVWVSGHSETRWHTNMKTGEYYGYPED